MALTRVCTGAVALVAAMACGGQPTATPAAPAPASEPLQQSPPVSLDPVGAPRELFAVMRVQNVAKLADIGVRWTSLPVEWRNLVAKELPGLERVVAFDAPVDVVAMLDPGSIEPHVFWAFAFGIASPDAMAGYFRDKGENVIRRGPGVYALHGELDCVAAPARGVAPARLVCSEGMDSVDALTPYLTRGLPTEAFGRSEFHAHVTAEPFRRRYGSQMALLRTMGVPFLLRELELGHPRFDRALRDATYGAADELIALARDVDRIDVDASLSSREDAIDTRTTIAMTGQQSWTAQGIVRAAGSAAAAPDFFWQLPKDSTAASYSVYADPEHARGLSVSLGNLLDGYLDYQGLGDPRRKPLVDAFVDLFAIGARSVYASLPPPARATAGASASDDAPTKVIGAHVFALDHGGDRMQKFASELVKSINDRPFRERLIKSKLLRADQVPVARERAPRGKKGLPPGSKTFELEFPASAFSPEPPPAPAAGKGSTSKKSAPATAARPKNPGGAKIAIVLVVVPEGSYTWFGFGTDEAALIERLVELKGGNGATLTLRDGLGPLHGNRAVSAGFSSLGAVGPSLDSSLFPRGGPGLEQTLGRLPHRGQTPILWDVLFEATGPKITVSAGVPQAVVEDVMALVVSLRPNAIR